MASFRKRESGLWQATIRMTGYPSQSKTFERKIDAEIWARKIETDIDKGIFQSSSDAEKTTLADLIDRFKKEYAPFHYRKREDEKEAWRFQLARLDSLIGKYSLAAIVSVITQSDGLLITIGDGQDGQDIRGQQNGTGIATGAVLPFVG